MTLDTIIVGAGLSGLTVAHKLKLKNKLHKILVFDKADRVGGVIKSHHENGYISEIGPHGFLDNCKESRLLLDETGLKDETVTAPLIDFVRYVYLNGRLNMIPQTPIKIAKAPLITWKEKFRVFGDIFKAPLKGEPSVEEWIEHRFGPALLPFIDAVFTGTYAGDYKTLSIDAVMPGVRAIEKRYGSVILGLIRKSIKAKLSGTGGKLKMPAMTSFPKGMERLPEKLAEQFTPDEILLNTGIKSINRCDDGWQVVSEQGDIFNSKSLVLALPTNESLRLLTPFKSGMPLACIPEAWIISVIMGFENVTLPPGFGFLTPEIESKFTLGCLFSSNMFPGRAPENHVVMEVLVGGKRHPERVKLSDDELIQKSLDDIQGILDLPTAPVYTRVLRSNAGIPQLEDGYTELLAWRDAMVTTNPGLHLCGFGWEGIGINDMVKAGTKVASAINSASVSGSAKAEVKGIYF
ncbi:MAG: protoporphyrinogen oxidase [Desulfotalea sp.]